MPATTPRNENRDQLDKASDAAARTARAVADEAARVGEQTARAGADMARRGTETARDALQSGLNTATETFRRITDQFTQVLGFSGPQAEELAHRASQNVQAVSQANTVLMRGFQEASHEWINLAQERVTKSMEGLNRLARSRSVQDFVAAQSDLVRDDLQRMIEANQRVAELSMRTAEEAARIIQAQADQSATQARRIAH